MKSPILRSIDPADGSIVGEIACASAAEVDSAVARAAAAAPAWSAIGFEERAHCLARGGAAIAAAADELGELMRREMGKPAKSAVGEARGSGAMVESEIETARQAVTPQVHVERGLETTIRHDPLGVVGVITPWNFPLYMPATLIYPALLVGNTVVWKPSEKTPLLGARWAQILTEHLPAGVLEHVSGAEDTGAALVRSSVRAIAFVGSQSVGKLIMRECASDLKRIVLEMGGKDPMIVCADADLEQAAAFAASESLRNSGQVCCSVERIYVEETIADRFEAMVVEKARSFEIGPMVDEGQRRHVARQVDEARQKGARVLLGGEVPPGPGFYYPPTVVTGAREDMSLMSEETFGPVVAIRRVKDADEALALANTTEFGLGATVWSRDDARAAALAARIEAGMVGINRGIGAVGDAPWVGARQSGYGFMGSIAGVRHFTQVRTITRALPASAPTTAGA